MKDGIIAAAKEGKFIEHVVAINSDIRGDADARKQLVDLLVELNNQNNINLPREFCQLVKNSGVGHDYFLTRDIFHKTLPDIESPVDVVADCVCHLYAEAGEDLAAASVLSPFQEYCRRRKGRAFAALAHILASMPKHQDLVVCVMQVGSEEDFPRFFNETRKLCGSDVIEVRSRALWALGELVYPDGSQYVDAALALLEEFCGQDSKDSVYAAIVHAACQIYIQVPDQESRVCKILSDSLSKHGAHTLHIAAAVLVKHSTNVPSQILNILLSELEFVESKNEGTVRSLDFGVSQIIESEEDAISNRGLDFLDVYINKSSSGEWVVDKFPCTSRVILDRPDSILSRLATRWLISGDRGRCEYLNSLISTVHDTPVLLSVDTGEVDLSKPANAIFIARKSIGFLFHSPVSSASFIASLFRHVADDKARHGLIRHLYDPLLINYPGSVKDYLSRIAGDESEPASQPCQAAIDMCTQYTDGLDRIDELAELRPPLMNTHIYDKRMSDQVQASMKDARSKSVLLSLVSTSTLLYGRTSISYIQKGPGGDSERMEMPLSTMSTKVEVARQYVIDPAGIDYELRKMRCEHFE